MIDKLNEFWGEISSVVIALVRLVFLTFAMVTSAVHITIFTRTEVCNIELKGQPWRCDREKIEDHMSFIEKTCIENQDLLDYADENSGDLPPIDDSDDDDKGCFGE